jgi:hypothetical protein
VICEIQPSRSEGLLSIKANLIESIAGGRAMLSRCFLILLVTFVPVGLRAAPVFGDSLTFDELRKNNEQTMMFDLQNNEQILTYYDQGFAGFGSGPGRMFGVSFTTGLAADSTTIAFDQSAVLTDSAVTMNLDDPWSGLVSFYYAGTGSISFYSGLDATGALVASYPLLFNPPFGFPFGATLDSFQSAVFSRAEGSTLFVDSITFGLAVIPEPSPGILVGFGTALLLVLCRAKAKGANKPHISL